MLFASEIKHPVATIYDLPVTVDTFDAGVAIAEIDTRKLTRIIRDKGAQRGCIMAGDAIDVKAAKLAINRPGYSDSFEAIAGMVENKVTFDEFKIQWDKTIDKDLAFLKKRVIQKDAGGCCGIRILCG